MQKIVAARPQWRPLLEFRNWLVAFTRDPANRVYRDNGTPGRLTMAARQAILARLRALETEVGRPMLSDAEYETIQALWASGAYGDEYKTGHE